MLFPIVFLLVVVSMTLLVTRIAAVALTLTGLSQEASRFQARSALAGVGYTTSEAELVVNHPVRRRIIMILMLIGNIGVPTVVATLVVSMLTATQSESWWKPLFVLVAGLIALLFAARSHWLESRLNRLLARILQRWTDLEVRDYAALFQLQNGYAVSEMLVEPDDWIDGKSSIPPPPPRKASSSSASSATTATMSAPPRPRPCPCRRCPDPLRRRPRIRELATARRPPATTPTARPSPNSSDAGGEFLAPERRNLPRGPSLPPA